MSLNQSNNNLRLQVHKSQAEFINCTSAPYLAFVGGRGAGKSYAGALRLWKHTMEEPALYGMYSKDYPTLSDTVQRTFLDVAAPHIKHHDKARNIITMSSGSEILCRSLGDPDNARGPSILGAAVDEASLCPKEAFDILIACLRYQGKQGWLSCMFTPKGPAHWTGMFFDRTRTDCKMFHAATYSNPFLPPGFDKLLARQYTSQFARQEIEGECVSLGGGLFSREWFDIVESVPADMMRVRAWDLAATAQIDNQDPDYTAGALVGVHKGCWYICDMQHFRKSPMDTERTIRQTAVVDGPYVEIRMEQEPGASGKSLVDHFRRNVLTGYSFDAVSPQGDKHTRAMPWAAAAEAGNVKLLKGNWNKDFLDECEAFSSVKDAHDDSVDACSLAISHLRDRIGYMPVGNYNLTNPQIREYDTALKELKAAMTPEELIELDRLEREDNAK